LGTGLAAADQSSPIAVSAPTQVAQVSGGYSHTVAMRADGTVWAWGDNVRGELGNGTTTTGSWDPVQVTGLTGVVQVAAGYYGSLALRSDGTVWAWGWNFNGELGDGTTTMRTTPVQVAGLTGVTQIATSYLQRCFRTVLWWPGAQRLR
jgi:alpha-tubulin suppressor-like RCC1 family protein